MFIQCTSTHAHIGKGHAGEFCTLRFYILAISYLQLSTLKVYFYCNTLESYQLHGNATSLSSSRS